MKTYKISQAITLTAVHGFNEVRLFGDYEETDRLVTLHQNWTPDGTEIVDFRLARGGYKGQWIGNARRPKEAA